MPSWLKRALIGKGVLTEQGMTRRAKVMRCRACGVPTMAGFDSTVAAMDAWCDLTPLSAQGEVWALLSDRRTYALHGVDRLELERRDQWSITGHPAGSPSAPPVLASHRCGEPVPRAYEARRAVGSRPAPDRTTPGEFGF